MAQSESSVAHVHNEITNNIDNYFTKIPSENDDGVSWCSSDSFDFAVNVRYRERFVGNLSADIVFYVCQFCSVHTLTFTISKVSMQWKQCAELAMHACVERLYPGFLTQNTPIPFKTVPTFADKYLETILNNRDMSLHWSTYFARYRSYQDYDMSDEETPVTNNNLINYNLQKLNKTEAALINHVPLKYTEPTEEELEELEGWVDTGINVYGFEDNDNVYDEVEDQDGDLLRDYHDEDALTGEHDEDEAKEQEEYVKLETTPTSALIPVTTRGFISSKTLLSDKNNNNKQ